MSLSDYINDFFYLNYRGVTNIVYTTKIEEFKFKKFDMLKISYISIYGNISSVEVMKSDLIKHLYRLEEKLAIKKYKKMIMGLFTRKQNR